MKYNIPSIRESLAELKVRLTQERDAQLARRLHLLVLLKSGQAASRSEAARHLAVHRNTVASWLSQYEEDGLEGLCQISAPGPEPGQTSIPPEAMQALKERLNQPEDGFGSYHQIRDWLDKQFGVDLCYSTVHGIVRYQIGARPKTPRPSHEKNGDEQATFRQWLPGRLNAFKSNTNCGCTPVLPGRSARWAVACLARRITAKGIKPIQKVSTSYKNFYLYGAVEPSTGKRFTMTHSQLNSDEFQLFLEQFAGYFALPVGLCLTRH